MDTKHTPGPWKRQAKTGVNRWRIVDATGHQVADANYFNVDAEANADLIASAPSLLEALQGMHTALSIALAGKDGKQYANLEARSGSFLSMAPLMEAAEAAIARATGA